MSLIGFLRGLVKPAAAPLDPDKWYGPGQRHLARGFERFVPPKPSDPAPPPPPPCEHVWVAGPTCSRDGVIVCEACGTRWDKNQPHYVDTIKLVRR